MPLSTKPKFGAAIVSALALFTLASCDIGKDPPPKAPPPTVYVATAERKDVALYIESVGAVDGYVNAEIRARVRGYLRTQDYKDGASVKAGQTLFTIEPTDYVAATAVAKAAVARAETARTHDDVTLERDQGLFRSGMVSQQEIDNATATTQEARSQVESAKAQLAQAALNLSYTQIKSPISGVAGLALVRVGNLVGQDGPTLLTTVSELDPVRVNFPMSEVDFVRYPDRFKHLDTRDLEWAKKQFSKLEDSGMTDDGDPGVELVLADGSIYGKRGVIVAANRQIDATTGTIQLQALFPNPEGSLRPGQYGRVRMKRQDVGNGAIVVPERALIPVQGAYSLGIVGAGNKVAIRRVEVGPTVGSSRVIQKGLAVGDRFVVDGVQKIQDGVVVDPKAAPERAESSSAAGAAPATSAARN